MEEKLSITWGEPSAKLDLPKGEIHLWLASLEETAPLVRLEDLSSAEQVKAREIKRETVRHQFVVSRWLTRQVLSRYLEISPVDLQFGLSAKGKPFLMNAPGARQKLEFNRSHAGGWLALAVSGEVAVGVDIEKVAPRPQMEAIVGRWFEAEEREHFQSLPESEKSIFFHDCWTQKEAVLKAWGVGLVQLTDFTSYEKQSWQSGFIPGEGYAGCVAAAGLGTFRLRLGDIS